MKRRNFLSTAAVGSAAAAAGAASFPTPAITQERTTWTMVTTWPKNAPGVGVNAQRVADAITEMSGGRLVVELYAAGELVPPFESFDAVSGGNADIMHATPYYWTGKSQALHFFTGIPFGLMAPELNGWLEFGGGQALWDEVYAQFNLKPFYAGNSGTQAGGWFRREITSVDDLQGLRIRIAGLGGEVLRRLGAAITMLPPGEIFAAMQAGTVDAAEWVGPWNDLAFGLHQVANYYYMPAFHEAGPALEVAVNMDRYNALPDDLKAVVRHASSSISSISYSDFHYHNIVSLRPLVEEHNVQLRKFPDAVNEALGRTTLEVLADIRETDDFTRRVHDSQIPFLRQAVEYTGWMEEEMMRQRRLVFG